MDIRTRPGRRRGTSEHTGNLKCPARPQVKPAGDQASGSILAEILEPTTRYADRVLDVSVPEPRLQGSGVVPGVGEREAAGVAQHVRVDRKGMPARSPSLRSRYGMTSPLGARAGLGNEDVGVGAIMGYHG
jgi:hypothetical protein